MKKFIYLLAIMLSITLISCEKQTITVKRYSYSEDDVSPKHPLVTQPNTTYEDIVTDMENNQYQIITIKGQTWATENLRSTRYNDNSPIVNITSNGDWSTTSLGAYCSYNNDTINDSMYGKLYNFNAVKSGKLAPPGWHIATVEEWEELADNITSIEFKKIYGGYRKPNGFFSDIAAGGYYWTTEDDGNKEYAWDRSLDINGVIHSIGIQKQCGLSVRLIKD